MPDVPPAIDDANLTFGIGEDIEIRPVEGRAQLLPFGPPHKLSGVLTHKWEPSPRTVVVLNEREMDAMALVLQTDDPLVLVLADPTEELKGHIVTKANGALHLWPVGTRRIPNRSLPAQSLRFMLCNVPMIAGSPICYRDGMVAETRLLLEHGEYRVVIDAVKDSNKNAELARDAGSWGVTHVGEISRRDECPLDLRDSKLDDLRSTLQWFFGFVCEGFCGPLFFSGRSASGEKLFDEFWPGKAHRAQQPHGWSHYSMVDHRLRPIFDGLARQLEDPYWHEVLTRAVWWFVGASRHQEVGLDGALILAQAGVEATSWAICFEQKKLFSKTAWKDLKTGGQLDALAKFLKWSPDPAMVPHLVVASGTTDLFKAAVDIRNDFTHFSRGVPNRPSHHEAAAHEAYLLLMQLLELSILYLCDFTGRYAMRVRPSSAMEGAKVPWTQ